MLNNIDFKKMSYDEGLALVAETRKKALQRPRVKQANSMVDAVKQYWDKIPPEAKWSLLGAGAGGLGGLASSLIGKKDDEDGNYGRNILTGSLLGGLTGYGGRLGYEALTTPTTPTADFAQDVSSGADSAAKIIGHGGENIGLLVGGKKLGDTITLDMHKNKLSGTKLTNPAIDPVLARKELNRYLTKVEGLHGKTQFLDPQQVKNINDLKSWASTASDNDVISALSKDGFLGKNMGRSWVSKVTGGLFDKARRNLPLVGGRPKGLPISETANFVDEAKLTSTERNALTNKRLATPIGKSLLSGGEYADEVGSAFGKHLQMNKAQPFFRGSWKKPSLGGALGVGLPLLNIGAQVVDNYTGLNVPTPGGLTPDVLRTITNKANPYNY